MQATTRWARYSGRWRRDGVVRLPVVRPGSPALRWSWSRCHLSTSVHVRSGAAAEGRPAPESGDSQPIDAERPSTHHDEQTDEEFVTNSLEETMVALIHAPSDFAPPLRYQMVHQLLGTPLWVFLKEPAKAAEQGGQAQTSQAAKDDDAADEDEESFSILELDLPHSTRPCVPVFSSEARADEATRAANYGQVEGAAAPGLQLVQEFVRAAAQPTDLILNPFSKYGKRIAWEEAKWLTTTGKRLVERAAAQRELRRSSTPSDGTSAPNSNAQEVPDTVENPVRDPFKLFVERR